MRLLIVSNRAPVTIRKENDLISYTESSGGLVSGLRAYIDKKRKENPEQEILWIGWPGDHVTDQENIRNDILNKYNTYSVFIPENVMENFYEGFCNNTIWPLFHYFPYYTKYDQTHWENYIDVNKIFCREISNIYKEGDVIWIHDYHFMLLPALLREVIPDATIGFFLHIPFPSYEIFRLLPSDWRVNLIKGLFGADLIGFHTYDYRTYFLRSAMRILGLSNNMGEVSYFNRLVKVDNFPMGIDYSKYNSAVKTRAVQKEVAVLKQSFGNRRIILSIDRQDYSKGILNRLRAYEFFLGKYPEMHGKVMMIVIVIPSRVGVYDYKEIKSHIDELTGRINGTYGTMEWMPIIYQYRSLKFEELIALYSMSDVALVTPLRDGMNLVAKEFIACKVNNKGVLILSEMAGAADELGEAIIINPNNVEEVADAICEALRTDLNEQKLRLNTMQKKLKENDIFKWADGFLDELKYEKSKQARLSARKLTQAVKENIKTQFRKSNSRILFLDYDGTLQPFSETPERAVPREPLLKMLEDIISIGSTEVVIISGRDWKTMEKWFGHLPLNLVAEHGLFLKEKNQSWKLTKPVRKNWQKKVMNLMKSYVHKLPGALVEQKDYSVAFHYRRCDPEQATLRIHELISHLANFTSHLDVQLLRGNKVIEIKSAGIDKGIAAMHWLENSNDPDRFILAIGDDLTDEDLFRVIPEKGYSIKVGREPSYAQFNLDSSTDVINLLCDLIK
jgi:trehalose 6-phosphate synthase/phosphatase